jgi:molybdopterin-containing oxidoreductase family membrane subunit
MRGPEARLLTDLFSGQFAGLYWSAQILGMALPAVLLMFKSMRKPLPVTLIAIPVVVFAWVKRYLIVTPILLHPYLPIQNAPASWMNYFPSWIEIEIVAASLAGVLLIITLFSRFFPIISIWETLENEGIELDELDELNNTKNEKA